LARLDRYANFGEGREGAGLAFAEQLLEADADDIRWGRRRKAPSSAAYYVPLLEEVSKQWRRNSAPRQLTTPAGWRSTWARPKRKRRRPQTVGTPARNTEQEA